MGNKPILPASVQNRQVVVIGAGYGGVSATRALEAAGFDITLIDPKGFFYHSIGSVRLPAVTGWIANVAFPLDKLLKRPTSRLVVGKVKHIDVQGKRVELITQDGGEATFVDYDYLVVATGASRPTVFPTRVPDDVTSIEAMSQRIRGLFETIKASKNVVVVGGGPVGLEVATELRYVYLDKEITVVCSADTLLKNYTPHLSKETTDAVLTKLRAKNIKVLLNQSVVTPTDIDGKGVVLPADKSVTTSSGTMLSADLVFFATGNGTTHKGALSPFPLQWLNDGKQIKVNGHLQVSEISSTGGCVFAVGDVTDIPETKLAVSAKEHGKIAAANIIALATGTKPSKSYKPPAQSMAFMLLGPSDGVVEIGGSYKGKLGTMLVKGFKGKDLLASATRSELHLR